MRAGCYQEVRAGSKIFAPGRLRVKVDRLEFIFSYRAIKINEIDEKR
jgi:hypothetical protein